MARHASLRAYGRPGASTGRTAPSLRVIEGRRGKPAMLVVRATEIADLADELTAAGMDMVAMSSRLEMAYTSQRLDLIPALAARLRSLGLMYQDCDKPTGSAA